MAFHGSRLGFMNPETHGTPMRKSLWLTLVAVTLLDLIGPKHGGVSIPRSQRRLVFSGGGGERWLAQAFPSKAPQPSVTFTSSDSYRFHGQAEAGLTNSSEV